MNQIEVRKFEMHPTTIVDSIVFRNSRSDKANDVFFKSSSTLSQRMQQVQDIFATGQMEIYYLNISNSTTAYSSNDWYTIDNLVLINFTTTYPDSLSIDSFMTKYDLTLEYKPLDSLPTTTDCSYTFIFAVRIPTWPIIDYDYMAKLMQDMYEDSTHKVCIASPNVVNLRARPTAGSPQSFELQDAFVYDMCDGNTPDDPYRDFQWYIHNDGFNENDLFANCNPVNPDGVVGADAKICECWDAGLTGQGVKVCIIASSDIYFSPNHNDLQNQAYDPLYMWDCTVNPCITLVPDISTGYGMRMGGIIAATKNNNYGLAGIAEESIISHIKIGNDFINDASMIRALQEALVDRVDIIATEYVSPFFSGGIWIELRKLHDYGRFMHPAYRGVIIIAPSGHTKTNISGSTALQYPACYNLDATPGEPEVIGVIGSNLYDKLETGCNTSCDMTFVPGGGKYSYPSNFGKQYDVAAPCASWYSTEFDEMWRGIGAPQNADEVAVVAGVVALLLGDNPYLTDIQMRDRLRSGADKVGGYSYTGPLLHSDQLAAGRINCINSFIGWALSDGKILEDNQTISLSNSNEYWQIQFNDFTKEVYSGILYDINGNVIQKFTVQKGIKLFSLNHSSLARGLYIVNLKNDKKKYNLKATK